MDELQVILLILLPWTAGAGLGIHAIALRISGRQSQSRSLRQWVTLLTLSATAAAAAALLLTPHTQPGLALSWLPNAGEMRLFLGQSGLTAALVTTAVALLLFIIHGAPSPMTSSLLLLAAGSANLAFISGHFVSRYVALEIAGLCISLLPLAEVKGSEGGSLSRRVFLMLRLGDAGFLVAILLLSRYTGTLEIAAALEKTTAAPQPVLLWMTAGLILAVWVKMGIWPFHNWLRTGKRLSAVAGVWAYQTLMPNLGLYLLYRIQPLLTLTIQPFHALSWAGLAAACAAAIMAIYRAGLPESLALMMAVQGGLIISRSAIGQLNFIPCLIYLNLLNLAFAWVQELKNRRTTAVFFSLSGAAVIAFWSITMMAAGAPQAPGEKRGAVFVLFLVMIWIVRSVQYQHSRHAEAIPTPAASPTGMITSNNAKTGLHWREKQTWIKRIMQQDALEFLVQGAASGTMALGRWLYRVLEQDFLEQSLQRITTLTLGAGQWLYAVVENASLDGFLRWISRAVRALSSQLQHMHSGKLRANLIWVVVCFLVVMVTIIT